MKGSDYFFLINGILYLACGGLWLLSPNDKTLNFSLTILLCHDPILLYTGRDELKTVGQSYIYRLGTPPLIYFWS